MTVSIKEISADPGFGHDLPPHTLRDMLRYMMLARALDERMWVLNRAGKAPFVISCQGHEAAQVGAAFALTRGKDFILPYYRGLAMVLVMGMTPAEVMMGLFARATDPSSGGRQMPAHYGCRRLKIVTQSSPVGTQIPHAAGIGLAEKIKGGDAVVWVSFGEGTTSQGDFHEGVNLAAVHRLPVIFQCENNEYAISVHQRQQMAIASVAERAAAYGIPGVSVDGTDVLAVYDAVRTAGERARRGEGPTLVEAITYRWKGHSKSDRQAYRTRDEVKEWQARDPIHRLAHLLKLSEAEYEEIVKQAQAVIEDALAFANASPEPDLSTILEGVYA